MLKMLQYVYADAVLWEEDTQTTLSKPQVTFAEDRPTDGVLSSYVRRTGHLPPGKTGPDLTQAGRVVTNVHAYLVHRL
jgi:hypothetical protein